MSRQQASAAGGAVWRGAEPAPTAWPASHAAAAAALPAKHTAICTMSALDHNLHCLLRNC